MDLNNKQIRVVRMSTISMPAETLVDVNVLEETTPGVKSVVGSYELSFDEIYGGPTDPNLLLAIKSALENI
jgi:hypothetical protein